MSWVRDTSVMDASVEACARCGMYHESVEMRALLNNPEYSHWGLCPVTMQPILGSPTKPEPKTAEVT